MVRLGIGGVFRKGDAHVFGDTFGRMQTVAIGEGWMGLLKRIDGVMEGLDEGKEVLF